MRMKKLLTFLVLLTVSVGTWAVTFTWNSGDYIVSGTNKELGPNGDTYQVITVSGPGALSAFVNATKDDTNNPLEGVGSDNSRVRLQISGELTADDLAALNSSVASSWSTFTSVDLKGATISKYSDLAGMNMSGMQSLRLPTNITNNTEWNSLKNNGKNASLNYVVSTDAIGSSASTMYFHSFTQNSIGQSLIWGNYDFIDETNGYLGVTEAKNATTINMSGLLGDKDLYNNNSKNFAAANSFDFTGATFSSITLASVSGSTTLEDNPTYTNYETNSLYYISNYASVIESVVLPTGNTEVPINAFAGASNLEEIDIPSNYTKIGACAFYNSGVVWAEISKNMETVEPYAFLRSQLTDLVFEKGLTHLNFGTGAFSGISTLKHVVLPEGVLSLGNALFRQCEALESVRLPSTLTYIGEYCFSQTALSQITIPKGVERIDAGAFANCTNLTDVYVTNTERAPAIICAPQNPELQSTTRPSTFGRAQLINNTGSGYQGSFTGQENVTETWEEGLEKYRNNTGEKLIALHYPTTAAALYDEPDIVAQYNIVTSDNLTLPTRNHNDYSLKYGTCYTSWSDGHGNTGTFNQTNTFDPYYETAGAQEADSLEGYWTRRGWKQFAITKAYVPGESEVIPITLKDVWYTMCYPFNLSDELLEETYGAHYDICEFSSVEISNEYSNNGTYSIVLHFNEVATDKSEYDDPTSETSKQKDAGDTEYSTHFLAKAFHPYMIHPNTGTHVDEDKVETYFTGIKYLDDPTKCNEFERGYYYGSADGTTLQQGAWAKKVNIPVTLVTNADRTEVIEGEVSDAEIQAQGYTKNVGNFTFVGNVYRNTEVKTDYPAGDNIWANSANFSLIPYNAYFLGQASPTSWPKYYRETSQNLSRTTGKWTLYSSIILTDRVIEDALAEINGNILEAAEDQGVKSINAFELSFDEYEQPYLNEATNIKEVIEEAKENNLPVQFIDIVYDFNGKVVKRGDESLKNLPTGLYIVNGKKYMVK